MENVIIKGFFYNGIENNKINIDEYGIKKNNLIKFNIKKDTLIINLDKINNSVILKKNNNKLNIKYVFSNNFNNESYIKLNNNNTKINLNIETIFVKIENNVIDVSFMFEGFKSNFYIEYEVIK